VKAHGSSQETRHGQALNSSKMARTLGLLPKKRGQWAKYVEMKQVREGEVGNGEFAQSRTDATNNQLLPGYSSSS
jgi:hypothetical protein